MQQRNEWPKASAGHGRQRRIRAWRGDVCVDHQPGTLSAEARTRKLSRLVPLWPSEIEAADPAAAQRVVAALERALRGERRRGRAGHWSYDMNRHVALARALREEQDRLAGLHQAQQPDVGPHAHRRSHPIEKKAIHIGPL